MELLRKLTEPGGRELTALRFAGEELSYSELICRSAGFRDALRGLGLGPGDRVALALPHGVEAPAALLGTWALGAIAVPIAPGAPPDRTRKILERSGVRCLVTAGRRGESLARRLGARWEACHLQDWDDGTELHLEPSASTEPASVLHTSGSTGDPKGVVITRQHVDAFCSHWAERVQLQAGSRVAQVASLTFDLSLFELGATLGSRATLCPVPEAFLAFPSRLVEWLVEERISHWYSVPSLAGSLLDAGLPEQPHALDVLMVAGETLPAATARRMLQDLPATRLLNLFGPTETNVSCAHELAPDFDGDSVPIGRPCPYLQIAILGEDDQAAERGELVARGATVTPGYLDEAQSADWVEHAGQPWLRTGDRVERRDDGLLYFLGRADRMIKRRGFRIEPEELERALRSLDAVHEAAVVPLRAEEPGSARALVAFVEGSAAEPELLEAALRSQLPAEALPDRIVPVESLPRGARGKVDRASLELRAEVLMS